MKLRGPAKGIGPAKVTVPVKAIDHAREIDRVKKAGRKPAKGIAVRANPDSDPALAAAIPCPVLAAVTSGPAAAVLARQGLVREDSARLALARKVLVGLDLGLGEAGPAEIGKVRRVRARATALAVIEMMTTVAAEMMTAAAAEMMMTVPVRIDVRATTTKPENKLL